MNIIKHCIDEISQMLTKNNVETISIQEQTRINEFIAARIP